MQKYRIKRTLGDGTFGVVFEAISPSKEIVAIKKIKQKYKNIEECLQLRQIKSLRKLDHPNLIKLKQVILANSELYLVFDYVQTNLFQVYTRAQQSRRTLIQSEIKSIFYKMTHALAFLHRNGFFHRDLKPENILCHNDQVKICDFGLARQIRSQPPLTQYVSTRWYRAPQLLLHSGSYNSPVDIFALACIVIELYMMGPLFPGNNEIETMNKIVQVLGTPKKSEWPQGYKLAASIHYNFPEKKKKNLYELIPNADLQVIELLESMLSYSSRKRPSAVQILKHPYFDNYGSKNEMKDEQNETKISFYDKNPIEIPKNVKVQNPKDMEMRKSTIKFGNSFHSSFHKEKEKVQKIEQEQANQKLSSSKKNKFVNEDDNFNKKFDEMEEILLQLKLKQQKQKEFKCETFPKYKQKKEQQQLRLPMYSLDGMVGGKSTSNINTIIKSPLVKNMKN